MLQEDIFSKDTSRNTRIAYSVGLVLLLVFIATLGFIAGIRFKDGMGNISVQEPIKDGVIATITETPVDSDVSCPMDVRECPDGSYVGREAPSCEFVPCRIFVVDPVYPSGYPTPTSEVDSEPSQGGPSGGTCSQRYGGPADEIACEDMPVDARQCRTDTDCTPTCATGCVNSAWNDAQITQNQFACMSMPRLFCACIQGECQDSGSPR